MSEFYQISSFLNIRKITIFINFLQKLRHLELDHMIIFNSVRSINTFNRFRRFVSNFRQIHFVDNNFKNANEYIRNIDFTILNETKNFRNFFINPNIEDKNHFSIIIKKKSLSIIRNKRFKKHRCKNENYFSITMKKESLSTI